MKHTRFVKRIFERFKSLKEKIIFLVASVAITLTLCIVLTMSVSSIRATDSVMLTNMQITARIASQNISSNLHLLTERMYNLSRENTFTDIASTISAKERRLQANKEQIEFVWLAGYDASGKKLYGDESAPGSIAKEEYYEHIVKTGNMVIGEPYYAQNQLQFCVIAPLIVNQEVAGYLAGSYKYDILNDVLTLLVLGETGRAGIISEEGVLVADRDAEIAKARYNVYEKFPSAGNKKVFDKMLHQQTGSAYMKFEGVKCYAGYAPVTGTNWALIIYAPRRAFLSGVIWSIVLSVVMALVLLGLSAATVIPVTDRIAKALQRATKRLKGLAEGDLSSKVGLSESTEEMEILTGAMVQMVESLREYIRDIKQSLGALAERDYTLEVPDSFNGDFSSIRDSLCNITDALNQTMLTMQSFALEANKNANETSDYAKQLYDGSLEQALLLTHLRESMDAIAASLGKTGENALEIEECSRNANEKTRQGDENMQVMLETMQQIQKSVEEISKISQLIEGIAGQTRLLSLNASIEAARAGESGKGFAIVASQIGELSGKTADALKQTAAIIEHATDTIQKGQETATQTADAFREIKDVTAQYYEISNKLSANVAEQRKTVEAVNTELTSVEQIADQNKELAEETDKIAAGSLEQSQELKEYVMQAKLRDAADSGR